MPGYREKCDAQRKKTQTESGTRGPIGVNKWNNDTGRVPWLHKKLPA